MITWVQGYEMPLGFLIGQKASPKLSHGSAGQLLRIGKNLPLLYVTIFFSIEKKYNQTIPILKMCFLYFE